MSVGDLCIRYMRDKLFERYFLEVDTHLLASIFEHVRQLVADETRFAHAADDRRLLEIIYEHEDALRQKEDQIRALKGQLHEERYRFDQLYERYRNLVNIDGEKLTKRAKTDRIDDIKEIDKQFEQFVSLHKNKAAPEEPPIRVEQGDLSRREVRLNNEVYKFMYEMHDPEILERDAYLQQAADADEHEQDPQAFLSEAGSARQPATQDLPAPVLSEEHAEVRQEQAAAEQPTARMFDYRKFKEKKEAQRLKTLMLM